MKNILKKFLLIFIIGILSQPYIENTCWGMDKFIKIKLNNSYEFNANDIASFNPDGFWENSAYEPIEPYNPEGIDDSEKINHSSRGALAFVKGKNASIKFFKENFIAKGSNTNLNIFPEKYRNCILCRHNNSNPTTTRIHSEIAFLQYLTDNDNPKNIKNGKGETGPKFLTKYKDYQDSDQIIILIRNSYYIPCYWEGDPGYICMEYIADFCKELKEKTRKKITCIVQYEKDYPNFAEEKQEAMKGQKNKIMNKINSDEKHITEIEDFHEKKAIVYCY